VGILTKFKGQYDDWQIRKSAKIRLELLVSSITKHLQQLKGRDDVYSRVALRHAERADRNYKNALEHYAEEDFEECLDYIEKGELHIHFAHLQMAPQDTEYDPGFVEGSVQWMLDCFCQAITQTKMAIEYTNCKLSDLDRKDLIAIASLYTQALHQLLEEDTDAARSIAEGGLLLLHATVRSINIDNHGQLAEVRLPRNIVSRAWAKAKELEEYVHECKQQFALDTTLVSEKARQHLRGAEQQFRVSIDRLINEDEKASETAASAGMIEAKFAEGMISHVGSQSSDAGVSESIRAADFERMLARLRRLLKRTQGKNHESAEKHLAASQSYLSDAIAQMEKSNMPEASRLARAAYLDLDYARQLIDAEKPPEYIDA
jgi:hypothetical protein